MGRSNFNEAKRFITLIDTVYEAGIVFICSAAAQPEHLYLEGEGVFEFERTVSRLNEMQSESWGKSLVSRLKNKAQSIRLSLCLYKTALSKVIFL